MKEMRWYQLHFPTDLNPEKVLPWVRSLAARQRRGILGAADPVVFEAHARDRQLRWFLAASEREERVLLGHLRTLLPGVRTDKLEARPELKLNRAVEVRLNTTRRPLRSDTAEATASVLVTALHGVRADEALLLQWVVGPWLPRPVVKRIGPMKPGVGIERLVPQMIMDSEDASSYRKKLSEPVLGTTLRIGVQAHDRPRQRQLLQHIFGALQLVRQPGVGLVTRWLSNRAVRNRISSLHQPMIAWPCPVNAAELTAVLGWPLGNPNLPGIEYSGHRQLPPASGTTVSPGAKDKGSYRIIGRVTYPGEERFLHLPPQAALHHLHCIGPTGAGKSTLLAGLIEADVDAGRGVVVIEPKSDLIQHVLDRLPTDRLDDVVVLDPADVTRPVGLNVLACLPDQAELVVDQAVHVFHELYRDSWGPRTADVLQAGLLTLAKAGDQTICELPTLLTQPGYRRRLVERLNDPLALTPFWNWFNALSDGERREVIGPVLNKLRAFTYRRGIRAMLGQTQAGFSMRQVFTERKILLVNLAKGLIGPEASKLLGSLIFSSLWQTALGRAAITPERRHVVSVVIDEWQDFLSLPTELGEVLAQARGLGIALSLANQHLGQLSPGVRAAVLSNARSRVAFQTGSADASALAAALGGDLEAGDLRGLGPFEIYASLVRDSAPTLPASAVTLEPSKPRGTVEAARAHSRDRYGRDIEEVEAELLSRQSGNEVDPRLGGRRRRSE